MCTAVDEGGGCEAKVSSGSLALEQKPPEKGIEPLYHCICNVQSPGSGVLADVRDEPQEEGGAVC